MTEQVPPDYPDFLAEQHGDGAIESRELPGADDVLDEYGLQELGGSTAAAQADSVRITELSSVDAVDATGMDGDGVFKEPAADPDAITVPGGLMSMDPLGSGFRDFDVQRDGIQAGQDTAAWVGGLTRHAIESADSTREDGNNGDPAAIPPDDAITAELDRRRAETDKQPVLIPEDAPVEAAKPATGGKQADMPSKGEHAETQAKEPTGDKSDASKKPTSAGDTVATTDIPRPPETATGGGDGADIPRGPNELGGANGDNERLPEIPRRDEMDLAPEEQAALAKVMRAPINITHGEHAGADSYRLSLPGGVSLEYDGRKAYQGRWGRGYRAATSLRITAEAYESSSVDDLDYQSVDLTGLGVKERLLSQGIDQMVDQGIETVMALVTDTDELRTLDAFFGNAIGYVRPNEERTMSPARALATVQAGGGIFVGVDMEKFLNEHPEYIVTKGEKVLLRCDLHRTQRTPGIIEATGEPSGSLYGEVNHFRRALHNILPEDMVGREEIADRIELVLTELTSNWEKHVKDNPGNQDPSQPRTHDGFVVLSQVPIPNTDRTILRLARYAFDPLDPERIKDVNEDMNKGEPLEDRQEGEGGRGSFITLNLCVDNQGAVQVEISPSSHYAAIVERDDEGEVGRKFGSMVYYDIDTRVETPTNEEPLDEAGKNAFLAQFPDL